MESRGGGDSAGALKRAGGGTGRTGRMGRNGRRGGTARARTGDPDSGSHTFLRMIQSMHRSNEQPAPIRRGYAPATSFWSCRMLPAGRSSLSSWHGAFPNQIQPGVSEEAFRNIRRVAVRATPHSVCLRLIEASTSVTDGRPVFRGGWLESRADKHHKLLGSFSSRDCDERLNRHE